MRILSSVLKSSVRAVSPMPSLLCEQAFPFRKQNVSYSETPAGGGASPGVPFTLIPEQRREKVDSPADNNIHHLLTPSYDPEERRTRMAARAQRKEKSEFVAKLEGVLPLLQERLGVAKIGIFGSAARGEERADSDVDVLVEFAPGQTTFRNFMELAFYLEDLFGRKVDLLTVGGIDPLIRQDVESEVVWCEA
jgi:predicted nucleotidyltransferase